MTGTPSIEFQGVTKRYGDDVVALDDLSLTIEDGEFFTLLGPSGSGKSTLLHLVGGFQRVTEGSIYIDGEDVTDRYPQSRPVSTVFQEYALFPHMTVEENVAYGLKVQGVDRDRRDDLITRYLELLEISELRDRNPSQLSGGQRQRVALTRSLVIEPSILLLDEPLGPLDENLRRAMQVELKTLQERLETTFVYVTHDQEEALTMSDRIGLLNEGELVEVGTPSEIYSSPRRRFTVSFIGSGNLFDGIARDVSNGYVSVKTNGGTTITGRTAANGIVDGTDIAICIRPHHIRTNDDNFDNSLTGTVVTSVYKGDEFEYILELPHGDELTVVSRAPIEAQEGETVRVGWSRDDCVVVMQ